MRERLKRINEEFITGFKGLFQLGPAVTVFGSARFDEDHPYHGLARRRPSAQGVALERPTASAAS